MKTKLLKTVILALLFSSLVLTSFCFIGFGVYPGPDELTTKSWGMGGDEVTATAKGWYESGTYHLYKDTGHKVTRAAAWPYTWLEGNLKCHYKSSEYDIGEYEFPSGVNEHTGAGYDIWAEWVWTWSYSKFHNILGGIWSRQTSAQVDATPL